MATSRKKWGMGAMVAVVLLPLLLVAWVWRMMRSSGSDDLADEIVKAREENAAAGAPSQLPSAVNDAASAYASAYAEVQAEFSEFAATVDGWWDGAVELLDKMRGEDS